jgi:hypothetical protein
MNERAIDRLSKTMAEGLSRRQVLRLLGGGAAAGSLAMAGLVGFPASRQASAQGVLSFPVNFVSNFGSFVGTFDVTQFTAQGGRLLAVGTLTGDVADAAGSLIGSVSQDLTLPVTQQTFGSCQVLHLELGPLNLDLLGLRVHLNRVVLDITADPSGGLLGELLCSIANLLNGGGPLSGLGDLLNQLLGVLGGI